MSQNSINSGMSSTTQIMCGFEENIEQNFSQNGLKIRINYSFINYFNFLKIIIN
jgi:hypothetical protein